jgi:CheY-like chemotaxis protein
MGMGVTRMIFIVDEGPIDAELTRIALEEMGREINICSATDGKSALAMLRHGLELPAILLLGIKMRGMSGIEVLREIRADDRLRELPVVVVTSSALESDREESIAAGASDYIQKSLSFNQFSKDLDCIVHRWLPN